MEDQIERLQWALTQDYTFAATDSIPSSDEEDEEAIRQVGFKVLATLWTMGLRLYPEPSQAPAVCVPWGLTLGQSRSARKAAYAWFRRCHANGYLSNACLEF